MSEIATYQAHPSLAVSIFATGEAFEQAQRAAKLLAASDLLPKQFQGNMPNCVVAMEMANRIGASPFAVFQNLYVVHGRPGWSAQFLIAMVNQSGRFTPLQFRVTGEGKSRACIAFATSKETGEIVEGPEVSIKMAEAEGWLNKPGSKWQTMPDVMLRYRAASFFAKLYAPDITMGMQTAEELHDAPPERNVTPQSAPAEINIAPAPKAEEPKPQPAAAPVAEITVAKAKEIQAQEAPAQKDDKAERIATAKRLQDICREHGETPSAIIPGLIARKIVPAGMKPGDLLGLPLDTLEAAAAAALEICGELAQAKEELP